MFRQAPSSFGTFPLTFPRRNYIPNQAQLHPHSAADPPLCGEMQRSELFRSTLLDLTSCSSVPTIL